MIKTWEIIEKRWAIEDGLYSKPNMLMSIDELHKTAKNEILNLLDRIKELEAVCKDMNDYIDGLELWEDAPSDDLQGKIKEMVYGSKAEKRGFLL